MIKKIALAAASVLVALALPLAPALPAYAQGDFGLSAAGKAAKVNTSLTPETVIGSIIKSALQFVGILFFLLMLYAGFLWMTARGNEKTVERAKEIIIAAVIGLVIITAAYAITSAVIGGVSGTAATQSNP